MIDTHCHLTHARFAGDVDAVVERARAAGVSACVTIGTGPDDARAGQVIAARHAGFVLCAAGIDPFTAHRMGEAFDAGLEDLAGLLRAGGFAALGEVGLDYHYDLDPRPLQRERLERQLELAVALDMPVVIHVREAHADMLAVLRAHPRNRGVIHSFTAGAFEAEAYLALGWHLAFNGVLTYANAANVREAARITPLERLLLETDAPYLAPVPHRGTRCEPAHVAATAATLARVRGTSVEDLAAATTAAARALFGIATPR